MPIALLAAQNTSAANPPLDELRVQLAEVCSQALLEEEIARLEKRGGWNQNRWLQARAAGRGVANMGYDNFMMQERL
jgi:hypothetical protein